MANFIKSKRIHPKKNNQRKQHIFFAFVYVIAALFTPVYAEQNSAHIKAKEGYLAGADGNKIFYREIGDAKETIIYLHGGPGFDLHDGGYELDRLAQNYRLIGYDQRGGGYSEEIKDPTKLAAQHHVADIEAIRTHFKLDKFTLIGMSWGSGLAMLYANQYPEHLKRIVLLAPMPIRQTMMDYRLAQTDKLVTQEDNKILDKLMAVDLTDASDKQIIDNCRRYIPIVFKAYMSSQSDWKNLKGDLCGSSPQGIKRRWTNYGLVMDSIADFDWTSYAANYQGPVYILEGEWSMVPLNTTREWAGYMPNSRVEFIKKAGHIVWLDNPTELIDSIEVFMKGQWPANANKLNPTHLDLLARYSFSANLKNDMDNRFDGKATHGVTFGTDRFGNANSTASFANKTDHIVIPTADWTPQPKHWSWTGWFKVNQPQAASHTLLTQGDGVKLKLISGKLGLSIDSSMSQLQITDTQIVTAKEWFHIGVVQDGNTIKLYRDGTLVAAGSSASLGTLAGDFTMQNHAGEIDDLRIYAKSLNQQQMLAVYHQIND